MNWPFNRVNLSSFLIPILDRIESLLFGGHPKATRANRVQEVGKQVTWVVTLLILINYYILSHYIDTCFSKNTTWKVLKAEFSLMCMKKTGSSQAPKTLRRTSYREDGGKFILIDLNHWVEASRVLVYKFTSCNALVQEIWIRVKQITSLRTVGYKTIQKGDWGAKKAIILVCSVSFLAILPYLDQGDVVDVLLIFREAWGVVVRLVVAWSFSPMSTKFLHWHPIRNVWWNIVVTEA